MTKQTEAERKKAEEALIERIATEIIDGDMEAECPYNVAKRIVDIVNVDKVAPKPSLHDAAIIVAEHIDDRKNEVNQMVYDLTDDENMPVRHWFSKIVRGIAERNQVKPKS